jgi:FlaA1/EpsC-like NDP-sugar epimerase
MINIAHSIGRTNVLFDQDITQYKEILYELVSKGRFLVIGGAGSIGQSVVREIFKRDPLVLHVVDINENNLVELVRDIRSSLGYIRGDFKTYAIDCGSLEFEMFMNSTIQYDYILNLSALKHVRSEKDPFTLMRLIQVNILNTIKILQIAKDKALKNYFSVSTDKAANPVNMMGASKKIMEMFLIRESKLSHITMARFANVAFSDGSLLHGFNQRFAKLQPISAPNDILRYFLTPQESGELCLLSCLLAENRDIFFPKLGEQLKPIKFSEIATRFIENLGYTPYICESEEEARFKIKDLLREKKWPCYFFESDTTGEKDIEEFFTLDENIDLEKFNSVGIIKNNYIDYDNVLDLFLEEINMIRKSNVWDKSKLIKVFEKTLKNFNHIETGKYLDSKM